MGRSRKFSGTTRYARKPSLDVLEANDTAEVEHLRIELRRVSAALDAVRGVVRTVNAVVAPYAAKAEAGPSLNRKGLNALRASNADWRTTKR
jgi:hypothetical protein